MTVSALSSSTQDYLKAVWNLQEWGSEPVTATALAAKTGVRVSTASDALRRLADQGLVEHAPYGSIALTPVGTKHALAMVRRHRLIETFLVEVLGYRWDQVHDEAESLEHAVSDFMVERIAKFLGDPVRDPHGDPIPSADGVILRPRAVTLADLPPGTRARVERITDDDPGLLQFLATRGVGVGALVQARPSAPYSDSVEVSIGQDEGTLALGIQAAQAIWVAPIEEPGDS